jgi:proteasome accessory factor C
MADELARPMRPTPVESLRLLLIAKVAEQVVGQEVPALRSAIAKLARALGVPAGAVDVIEPDPDAGVVTARRAIAEDRCVRFSYRGRIDPAPVEREVEPWRLDLREGAWYLHGWDRAARAPRIFRLDRAAGMLALDVPRAAAIPDELPQPRYEPGPDDVEVELRLAPEAAWLLDALEADDTLPDAGSLIVRMRTGAPEWLARLVLMCGGSAEVVRPAAVRELVRSRAQQAVGLLDEIA